MAYMTFFSSFSILTFDRLKKLFLRLKQKRKPSFWHKVPLYRKWFLMRKQNLMLKWGILTRCKMTIPKRKKNFIEVTSKDREIESTEADPNPLFSLLSPPSKVVCSKLLSKYPKMMGDIDKWTLPLRSFMLERIRFVLSQLQFKGKEDSLTFSFDEFLSTLGDAESMSFNVKWLKSCVIALRDLKRAGPSVHASLSLLQQLRIKRTLCINKVEETKLAIKTHITSITQL